MNQPGALVSELMQFRRRLMTQDGIRADREYRRP